MRSNVPVRRAPSGFEYLLATPVGLGTSLELTDRWFGRRDDPSADHPDRPLGEASAGKRQNSFRLRRAAVSVPHSFRRRRANHCPARPDADRRAGRSIPTRPTSSSRRESKSSAPHAERSAHLAAPLKHRQDRGHVTANRRRSKLLVISRWFDLPDSDSVDYCRARVRRICGAVALRQATSGPPSRCALRWTSFAVSCSLACHRSSPQASEGWRRRPDLNRGWRFCRAIPGRFPAIADPHDCTGTDCLSVGCVDRQLVSAVAGLG